MKLKKKQTERREKEAAAIKKSLFKKGGLLSGPQWAWLRKELNYENDGRRTKKN